MIFDINQPSRVYMYIIHSPTALWSQSQLQADTEFLEIRRPVIHENINAGWKSSSRSGAALHLTLDQHGAMYMCDPRRGAKTPSHHSHVHSAVHHVCAHKHLLSSIRSIKGQ